MDMEMAIIRSMESDPRDDHDEDGHRPQDGHCQMRRELEEFIYGRAPSNAASKPQIHVSKGNGARGVVVASRGCDSVSSDCCARPRSLKLA